MANMSLKSAAWNIFLKFVILGVFAIVVVLIGFYPLSLLIQTLENFSQWIVIAYLILVVEEYLWG
jgi:hypothetical protein